MNDQASALQADPARAFDGQYQLGAEIGAGALGVVYRGVDEKLDKPVAIKVWHARLGDDTALREQYDAEARALTALDHPNLVATTDYGIAGEAPYLIMELLEGQTLEARMRAGALPSSLTQTFMQSVLRGLGYMHMRGVVHRNLNPDNVFLHKLDADAEQLKLLDMGLESLSANTNAGPRVTRLSAYEAPEQEAGTDPDGRSDVYAAGVLMLHMLSGSEPGREALRAAADSAQALEALLPSAPPEVRAFIARAVANERPARFGNADQMLRALLELPTPWSDQPEPAPAPLAASAAPGSFRPKVVPAHAELEGTASSVAHAETAQLPAAESGDDEELAPIGLMAKLRARKRVVLVACALAGAALTAGVVALWPSSSAEPEHSSAHAPAAAKAKEASPQPTATADEPEQEEEEEPVVRKFAEPTPPSAAAEGTQAEPLKLSARLADPEAETHVEAEPEREPSPTAQPAAAQTAEQGASAAKPAGLEPLQAQAQAAKPELGVLPAKPALEPPASAPSEHVQTGIANGASAEAVSGSVDGHAAAPPAPALAKPAELDAPAPVPLGSERQIEPDKSEIRHMLALAIAAKPRLAAKNPWTIDLPDSLKALREAIAKGGRGSAGNLKALRRYNAENPEDVYGHLLLAGFYANRGYSLDALDQFDMAYRIDSSSRGAPEMLKHALTMLAEGIAETDAVRFVERVYGREALGAIAQLAQSRDTSAAAARRLKQLQARISGSKRR